MNTKRWIALALALAALGVSVWAVVLLVIMVAHAVSTFVTAIVLLVVASLLGWGALLLTGQDVFTLLKDKVTQAV